MAGKAHLCSMMPGISAGTFPGWGGEAFDGSLTCLMLHGSCAPLVSSAGTGARLLHVARASSRYGG